MPRHLFRRDSDSGFMHPVSHEITPQSMYLQRRDWLRQVATGAAGLSLAAWASRDALAQGQSEAVTRPGKLAPLTGAVSRVSGANTIARVTSLNPLPQNDALTAVGYGESKLLINPETNDDDYELNRRVEFKVVGN